jgi:antitoxin (DNA-binding transcriptional repressor) of toxin-antitoxin stability system
METFTVRDLRERTGDLARNAESGQLSAVARHGHRAKATAFCHDRSGFAPRMAPKTQPAPRRYRRGPAPTHGREVSSATSGSWAFC